MKGKVLLFAALFIGFTFFFIFQASATIVTYTYDGAGRLTAADYGLGKCITYRYDLNGNLLEQNTSFSLSNAIRVLRIMAGIQDSLSGGDIDGDTKISIAEAVYVLQAVAGLRE